MGRVRIVALNGPPAWLLNDTNRQAVREKSAETYVKKAKAQVAGTGRIVFRYHDNPCYNCLFREVEANSERSS